MKLTDYMNQTLADLNQMLMLTYQIHWYMRGERFLHLHPMLDDYIEEYQEAIDEIAEKNIIIGGTPLSTLEEMVEHSTLKFEKGNYDLTMNDQLAKLLDGLKHMETVFHQGFEIAEDEGKQAIADVYTDLEASTAKHIWMINAELGRSARA